MSRTLLIAAMMLMASLMFGAADAQSSEQGTSDGASTAQAADASHVVDRLDKALVAAMKGGAKLGYQGRYKLLKPVVEDTYDLTYVAQLSLGSHWSGFDQAQRKAFVKALADYTVANYAAQFDGYSGETFEVQSQQTLRPGIEMVKTRFTSGGGDKHHQFDYLLHLDNGRWRIINVVVDGVSDLSMKRAEYTQLLQGGGFDALLGKLKHFTESLSKQGG
ncbi:MAG: ABC transporter substrate-binding protein [Gammaproteobacteria bacterium]